MFAVTDENIKRISKVVNVGTYAAPAEHSIIGIVPIGVSATYKARSKTADIFGSSVSDTGLYAGAAVEMFAPIVGAFDEITVTDGRVMVYMDKLA